MATRLTALMLGAVFAAGAANSAPTSPCVTPESTVDYSGHGPEVELVIAEMAALPATTVILAGLYHDGANTVQPALLVSRDGGIDWKSKVLPVAGGGIGHVTTDGAETAWAVISTRQEGLDLPSSLLRSRDGGESWCAIALDNVETLNAVDSLRFFDRDHGIMVFTEAPFGAAQTIYHTTDGGDTWQRLWRSDPALPADVETEFAYPMPDPPPHAPIWRTESGRHRIAGLLRLRPEGEDLLIERQDIPGDGGWKENSRLDRYLPTADLARFPN